MAKDAVPDRPSEIAAVRPPFVESTGRIAVTTVGPRDVEGCMYVGSDSEDIEIVQNGSIRLTWSAQSPAANVLQVTAEGSQSMSAKGTSPLWVNWTGVDGPSAMPFLVRIQPAGEVPLAIEQGAEFHIRLGATASIGTVQGPCS